MAKTIHIITLLELLENSSDVKKKNNLMNKLVSLGCRNQSNMAYKLAKVLINT